MGKESVVIVIDTENISAEELSSVLVRYSEDKIKVIMPMNLRGGLNISKLGKLMSEVSGYTDRVEMRMLELGYKNGLDFFIFHIVNSLIMEGSETPIDIISKDKGFLNFKPIFRELDGATVNIRHPLVGLDDLMRKGIKEFPEREKACNILRSAICSARASERGRKGLGTAINTLNKKYGKYTNTAYINLKEVNKLL